MIPRELKVFTITCKALKYMCTVLLCTNGNMQYILLVFLITLIIHQIVHFKSEVIVSHLFAVSLPLPIPLFWVITECQAGLPVLYSNFSSTIHFTHNSVYMLMLLSWFVPLPFYCPVSTSPLKQVFEKKLFLRNQSCPM